MTWFEMQQIAQYIEDLEAALDEWIMDPAEMRVEFAKLNRLNQKLRHELDVRPDSTKETLYRRLSRRLLQSQNTLFERLRG